jgi:hypothetical protein
MKQWRAKRTRGEAGVLAETQLWLPKEEIASMRQVLERISARTVEGRTLRVRLVEEVCAELVIGLTLHNRLKKGKAFAFEYADRTKAQCRLIIDDTGECPRIAFVRDGLHGVTEIFASAATLAKQRIYPSRQGDDIRWFDIVPCNGRTVRDTAVYSVAMACPNGVYAQPVWSVAAPNDSKCFFE